MQFVSRYIDWEESKIPLPYLQMICLSNPSKKNIFQISPPKKNSKNMCVPTYFPVPFPTQKTSKKNPKKLSRPWCLREVSCWKPSKIWMMIPWNPKRCLAVNIWIWKKKCRFEGGFKIVVTTWSLPNIWGKFYVLFGGFVVDTTTKFGGNDEYMFQMGWRNEARVFFFSWGSDGMRTNV